MTDMDKLLRGLIVTAQGLREMLDAEKESPVHFMTKTEYAKIFLTVPEMIRKIYDRALAWFLTTAYEKDAEATANISARWKKYQ